MGRNEGWHGEMLNPEGRRIYVDHATFKRLRRYRLPVAGGRSLRAVVWNKKAGAWQLTDFVKCLLPLWRLGPEFLPAKLRALNPERSSQGGFPPDGGRANRTLQVLGSDLSGLPCLDQREVKRLTWTGAEPEPPETESKAEEAH